MMYRSADILERAKHEKCEQSASRQRARARGY